MSRFDEVLHDLVVLVQEGIQLADQLFRVILRLLQLCLQSFDFKVEVVGHLRHVDEEAVLVLLESHLKHALIRVLAVRIRSQLAVDGVDLLVHFGTGCYDLFSELFHEFKSALRSLQNPLRHIRLRLGHELLVFAHLLVEQLWEDGLAKR